MVFPDTNHQRGINNEDKVFLNEGNFIIMIEF